jgi:hypothetical protein
MMRKEKGDAAPVTAKTPRVAPGAILAKIIPLEKTR